MKCFYSVIMTIKKSQFVLIINENKNYLVKAEGKLNCEFGSIDLDSLVGKKFGCKISSHTGKEFTVIEPNINDFLAKKMRRLPQVITQKDFGIILAETGVKQNAKVIEAGTGSAYATIMFANFLNKGKIYSYEKREDFHKNAKKNIEILELKNIKLYNQDIRDGIKEKDVDMILLDMENSEDVVKEAYEKLKPGAFLVVYSPYIEQVKEVQEKIKELPFVFVKTIENIQREWDVRSHTLPKRQGIFHTAFITFARKI